jgi:hypothetical protein
MERSTALEGLRNLMAEHKLTQREIAELACVSVKTVESWLADPSAASFRRFHPRVMGGILYNLTPYLRKRKAAKKDQK